MQQNRTNPYSHLQPRIALVMAGFFAVLLVFGSNGLPTLFSYFSTAGITCLILAWIFWPPPLWSGNNKRYFPSSFRYQPTARRNTLSRIPIKVSFSTRVYLVLFSLSIITLELLWLLLWWEQFDDGFGFFRIIAFPTFTLSAAIAFIVVAWNGKVSSLIRHADEITVLIENPRLAIALSLFVGGIILNILGALILLMSVRH